MSTFLTNDIHSQNSRQKYNINSCFLTHINIPHNIIIIINITLENVFFFFLLNV